MAKLAHREDSPLPNDVRSRFSFGVLDGVLWSKFVEQFVKHLHTNAGTLQTAKRELRHRKVSRKHIAEVRDKVQELQEQRQHKDAYVESAKEDDVQSTTSQNMRAEGLMHLLEEARSDVGTTVSYGPRFW